MRLALLLLILLLTGCIPYLPWDSSTDRFQAMQELNSHGCGFISGNGTPPASRIDAKVAGGWGVGMDPDKLNTCLEKLKELP